MKGLYSKTIFFINRNNKNQVRNWMQLRSKSSVLIPVSLWVLMNISHVAISKSLWSFIWSGNHNTTEPFFSNMHTDQQLILWHPSRQNEFSSHVQWWSSASSVCPDVTGKLPWWAAQYYAQQLLEHTLHWEPVHISQTIAADHTESGQVSYYKNKGKNET